MKENNWAVICIEENGEQWVFDTYKTPSKAQAACKRLNKNAEGESYKIGYVGL